MNGRVLVAGLVLSGLFASQAAAITGGQVDVDNRYSNVGAFIFAGIPDSTPNPDCIAPEP